jgi:predicted O-linked N-acetylglucosamine transferase (SPINDLY family)
MKELLQRARRAQEMGNLAQAARLYSDILRTDPRNFEALLSLGLLHFKAAGFDEAERLAGEATRLNPRSADAFFIRGCALQRLHRNTDALECFDRAVTARPGFVEALVNRGALLMAEKRHADALKSLDAALAINRAMPEAWNNRGNVLSELGRHEEAVASYEEVLAARPNFVEALINRGTALMALRRLDEALASYGEAARLSPERTDALAGRANAFFTMRDYERAAIAYATVFARDPDYAYARGNLAFSRLHCCDWSSLETDRTAIAQGLLEGRRIVNPFQSITLFASPTRLLRCATLWMADKYPRAPAALWPGERNADHAKIRVAYLSADFNGHAVATLLAGVWERHDKSRFGTTAISYVASNGSAMRQRVERAFDRVVDVAGTSDAEAAMTIRRLEIDIVVDLMGYTGECRPGILAQRPAPVQVNFLGFPGTMGASYVDYIIADPIVIPNEHRQHYCERIVHLPDTYLPADSARRISERLPSRAEAGLPNDGFVFCSFNNSYKLSPKIFDIWMRLLRNTVDGSVLWLPKMNEAAVRNLRREAVKRGVDEQRLVFAPFVAGDDDHLARLGLADLFLDTLPYNAHSTAVDALWAGVPVLTMRGDTFAGRVAASALSAAGLGELIATSHEDYEVLALKLAREPQTLSAIKSRLAHNCRTCALFDTVRYTRYLESAYAQMWQRHRNGEAPAHLTVQTGS